MDISNIDDFDEHQLDRLIKSAMEYENDVYGKEETSQSFDTSETNTFCSTTTDIFPFILTTNNIFGSNSTKINDVASSSSTKTTYDSTSTTTSRTAVFISNSPRIHDSTSSTTTTSRTGTFDSDLPRTHNSTSTTTSRSYICTSNLTRTHNSISRTHYATSKTTTTSRTDAFASNSPRTTTTTNTFVPILPNQPRSDIFISTSSRNDILPPTRSVTTTAPSFISNTIVSRTDTRSHVFTTTTSTIPRTSNETPKRQMTPSLFPANQNMEKIIPNKVTVSIATDEIEKDCIFIKQIPISQKTCCQPYKFMSQLQTIDYERFNSNRKTYLEKFKKYGMYEKTSKYITLLLCFKILYFNQRNIGCCK